MKAERSRLFRLQRLERVRAIAKQAAAAEAAQAESTFAQLEQLAERTRRLAADYAARSQATDGATLRQLDSFSGGLRGIAASASSDAAIARDVADGKLAALNLAERRRAAVEDRAVKQAQDIAKRGKEAELGSRRGFGTGLE